MLFVQRLDSIGTVIAFALAIIAVVVMLWLAMRFSNVVLAVLKSSGVELLTRIAGLLLSAIAVQLIVDAIRALIRTGLHG
jgi:multiple antibiotic resistance protein